MKIDVPADEWFGPHLTRLTEWIRSAREAGLTQGVIIVLDEFDEANQSMYLVQRGVDMFATIRSLSDQNVIWLFVGGERTEYIFLRHHATLNRVKVHRVDRITNVSEIEDMIVGPVRDVLTWNQEAINMVRAMTAGNPYYVRKRMCD